MEAFLASLGSVAGPAESLVLPAAAVFTRVSLLVFLLPGLSARAVPVRVRLAAALAITFLLLPAAAPRVPQSDLVPLLFGEALAGAYLALAFRLLIFVLSIAGTVISQAMSLSQVLGAALTEAPDTTVATLLSVTGAALFVTLGLHIEAIGVLLRSYESLPPSGLGGATPEMAERLLRGFADGLALGLSLALPFVLMNLAYYALLGLMNKAMPQLMVTFVGMPAITFAGLCFLAAGVATVLTVWLGQGAGLTRAILP